MNNYKVVVRRTGWPNGKLLEEFEKYFDSKDEALEFQRKNSWECPDETSRAFLYKFEPGWILK